LGDKTTLKYTPRGERGNLIMIIDANCVCGTRIEVPTVFGTLSAEVGGDPTYPSIQVCLDTSPLAHKHNDKPHELQIATIEATPNEVNSEGCVNMDKGHNLRVLVWTNPEDESHTHENTIFTTNTNVGKSQQSQQWAQYIQYLHNWADSKADPGFMGCTPACFDEWADSEDTGCRRDIALATKCGNCFHYISGQCNNIFNLDITNDCTEHDALPTVESRNDFTAPDVISELKNRGFNQLVENALHYVSSQGCSHPHEDYQTLEALLGDLVDKKELAAYVAFLHGTN